MILNVSARTDIVAFYTDWFMHRYEEGFLDVRNPFNPKLVSRIYFEDVDAILFCTKNPIPIVDKLMYIQKPIIFQVTLTPYKKNIEPNVPNKKKIISAIEKISSQIGKENVYVRYDPILLNSEYTVDYHKRAFDKMCSLLDGFVNKIIISFVDDYKNVRKNMGVLNIEELSEEDYEEIGKSFSASAMKHGMSVQTCCEDRDLVEYGFIKEECLSHEMAFKLTGKTYKNWKARHCGCVEMVDIGAYNSCRHFCKYCYANYDERQVAVNHSQHDVNSSLLVGHIEPPDCIKRRSK